MDTMGILLALLLAIAVPGLATPVEYQPIKITVNENFNAPPGVAHAHGPPLLGPSYVHQGANFFFNPQIQFPVGLMPPHVETIVATKPDIAFEEKVITEILKPLKPLPSSCIGEEVEEDIKITEIVVPRPLEVLPALPVPEPVEVIVEEHFNHPPLILPSGLPEPPILPPPAVHIIPPVITEEVIVKEPCAVEVHEHPVLLDEPIEVLPPLPMPPVLPPLVMPEIPASVVVEEVVEPCAVEVHEHPVLLDEPIEVLPPLPMPPVLPPVVIPEIHESVVVQEVVEPCAVEVHEHPILLDEPIEVLPPLPLPPVLPPLVMPEIPASVVVEEVVEPCAVEVHEHPVLPPFPMIPMPPVLPPVVVPEIPASVVVEEVVEPCAVEVHEHPVLPPLPMIPMPPALPPVVVPEIHESFVVEEVLEPKPCVEEVVIEEENVVPMVISKPQEVILGIIDAVPIINQFPSFSSIVETIKPRGFDTYYELPAFEHNHKIRKSLVPFPNLNFVVNPDLEVDNRIEYSTYCAHGIVAERIAPNIMMRGQTPKLLKLMSTRSAH